MYQFHRVTAETEWDPVPYMAQDGRTITDSYYSYKNLILWEPLFDIWRKTQHGWLYNCGAHVQWVGEAYVRKLCWALWMNAVREGNFLLFGGLFISECGLSPVSHQSLSLPSSENHLTFFFILVIFKKSNKGYHALIPLRWEYFLPLSLRWCVISWQGSPAPFNWWEQKAVTKKGMDPWRKEKAWESAAFVALYQYLCPERIG